MSRHIVVIIIIIIAAVVAFIVVVTLPLPKAQPKKEIID